MSDLVFKDYIMKISPRDAAKIPEGADIILRDAAKIPEGADIILDDPNYATCCGISFQYIVKPVAGDYIIKSVRGYRHVTKCSFDYKYDEYDEVV